MIPKKKAKQLVSKYINALPDMQSNIKMAKELALITVDEIMLETIDYRENYWKFVREEICILQ